MAKTTASLQAKLLALTGGQVDIMINEDEFKSTTQILREMAAVWEDMTDVEQAAALELIGGKRQANILASLISNFETAEEAIETASNSAGSAFKENETYLNSIEGKITQLTNSLQNMWNNAITSDGVKFFLDMANAIVKVVDKVGLLQVAFAGVFGALAFSGKNDFARFFTFNKSLFEQQMPKNGLFSSLKEAFSINKEGSGKMFDTTGIKKYISSIKAASAAESGFSKVKAISKAATDASAASDLKKVVTTKAVGVASKVASVGVQVLNAALTMGISLLATGLITGVMKLVDESIHRAENLKQEVQELTEAYNESQKSYNDNIEKLTTPSDTGIYSTLLEEFEALTQGVSKNGDNISLTADQYERYRDICDTIVEVNPDLAAGYDSNTEAIGNNANALRDLIAVQREAARREAVDYVSDDNMEKYAEEAINDHINATREEVVNKAGLKGALRTNLIKDLYGDDSGLTIAEDGEKIAREFLKRAGLTASEINKQIKDGINASGDFVFDDWYSKNVDFIADHVSGYSSEITKAAAEYRDASSDLTTAKDGMISELLAVPTSIDGYAELGGSEKSFITEWIKNSNMFKVDETTTQNEVLQMKKDIEDIVNNIIQGDYTTKLEDGTVVTASDILDSIFDFNPATVNWAKYQNDINTYVDQLWDAIGGEHNEFGFEDKDALKLSLGIDFQIEDESKMVDTYAKIKDVTTEEAQKYFDNLPATEVQRLLNVDWNVITNEDELNKILEPTVSTADPVAVYSTLAAEVEKYTAALSQSYEVASDNTIVTQEFKDSLIELVGSEEDLAECFDAANPLMVKNANELNKLIDASRNNVEANVDLAQSQARFKYHELVQELRDTCNVTSDLTEEQLKNAHSLLDQIDTVQLAVYKYQLLKESLSETGKAYQKFQEAQQVDELNTTGDNYLEMAQTVYDAFYKNGQVGTQAFDAAVQALVPDSVYASLKSDGDKLEAIYSYFNNKILPSLTLDGDSLSITSDDINNFVDKGLNKGLFSGSTRDGLSIVDNMDLEKGAKLMGMTEGHLKAMLAELDKYDYNTSAESFLSQIDDSFDGDVMSLTSKMQKLNEEKLRLLEDGGYEKNKERIAEINNELDKQDKKLIALQNDAVKSYEAYANTKGVIESLETVENKQQQISKIWGEDKIAELGLTGEETVQEAIDKITADLLQLEEPTELMIQFAQEGVIDQIDDLIADIEKDKKVTLGVEYDEDTGEYKSNNKYIYRDEKTQQWTTSLDGDAAQQLVDKLNTFDSLNEFADSGMVTTETLLSDIKATLNSLYKETTGKDAPDGEVNDGKKGSSKGDIGSGKSTTRHRNKSATEKLDSATKQKEKLEKELDKLKEKAKGTAWGSDEWDAVKKKRKEVNAKTIEVKGLRIDAVKEQLKEIDDLTKEDRKLVVDAVTEYENGGSLTDLMDQIQSIENEEVRMKVVATLAKEGTFDELLSDLDKKEKKIIIKALTEGKGDVEQLQGIIDKLPEEKQAMVQALIDYIIGNQDPPEDKNADVNYNKGKQEEPTKKTTDVDYTRGKQQTPQGKEADVDYVRGSQEKPQSFTAWVKYKIFGGGNVDGNAHALGTAFAGGTAHKGGQWGAKKTETALTGELGEELVVRGNRWFTVGENGAEFANIQKGDIIFNHKQTEELLKNGYVTSRGKLQGGSAHAEGTAPIKGTALEEFIKSHKKKRKKNEEDEDYIKSHEKDNRAQGTAHAEGTAYALWNVSTKTSGGKTTSSVKKSGKSKIKSKKTKEYSKDFEEVFDWFEIKLEEINEDLDLMAAKLENAVSLKSKNSILDSMIKTNKTELATLEKGLKLYNSYANNLLTKIPKKYRDEAKDGKIAIEEFAGKTDEKTLEAIKNYREWAQKAADISKQIEETKTEIAQLAKQQFDNISDYYSMLVDRQAAKKGHIEDMIDLQEERGEPVSEEYYRELIWRTQGGTKNFNGKDITIDGQIDQLTKERQELQSKLDDLVKKGPENGGIAKESDVWYEMVTQIHEVDAQIDECTLNLEEYQNAINEIHWNNFDELISRFDYVSEEAQNTIDLMSDKDLFKMNDSDQGWGADDVPWSKEGLATIGLYAQKMEIAKKKSQEYGEQITYLEEAYARGEYSESEYLEKLDELKQGQHDSIQEYKDAEEAIVDLNEARIDHIKEGIEKEIEAYEELIDKKKEELDAEKDLYDFQKSVMEQNKDIAKIERQLAALSGDNSASAMAKRRQLEAELAEAKAGLEETYYERSISNQQEALDKELETFQEEKDAEMEALEKTLENTEQIVTDSMNAVQSTGSTVLETLNGLATEYGVKISEALTKPWEDASTAINKTVENINNIETGHNSDIQTADTNAANDVDEQRQENVAIESAEYVKPKDTTTSSGNKSSSTSGNKTSTSTKKTYPYGKASATSGNIGSGASGKKVKAIQWALKDMGYSIAVDGSFGPKTKAAVKKFQKKMGIKQDGIVGKNTRKKFKLKGYAVGSMKINEDQLALLHELGDELVLHAGQNGKLEYLSKGSGVVPADLTSNLMSWGELNPQDILDRNRPTIGASPEVHATEINLNIQYGDMLKIENFKGDNPDEIAKIVAKQFEKHTAQLNQSLRKYVR